MGFWVKSAGRDSQSTVTVRQLIESTILKELSKLYFEHI